jgi:hypothetical protein
MCSGIYYKLHSSARPISIKSVNTPMIMCVCHTLPSQSPQLEAPPILIIRSWCAIRRAERHVRADGGVFWRSEAACGMAVSGRQELGRVKCQMPRRVQRRSALGMFILFYFAVCLLHPFSRSLSLTPVLSCPDPYANPCY